MATQDELVKTYRNFVPKWFYEDEGYQLAHTKALAAVFLECITQAENHVTETFIMQASGEYLDAHGAERGIPRISGESDESYAPRVQSLFGAFQGSSLQAMIDAILNNGTAELILNISYGYYDDDVAYDDSPAHRWLSHLKTHNWFSVVIPIQSAGDQDEMRESIAQSLNNNVVFGVTWDGRYRVNTDD